MSKQNRDQNRQARAAAAIAQQKRTERNRRLTIGGGVVVVVAVVVAALVWFSMGGSSSPDPAVGNVSAKVDGSSLVIGPDSAKTKVTVYEDFQCPYCREFENSSRDFLREAAADGKAQVTYKPFNLLTQDSYSARALSAFAAVLDKGTPKQALAFHDKLFDEQPYENASDKPDTDQLRDWAKDSGVTSSAVLSAIGPVNTSYVKDVTQAAIGAGVKGTPTVLANGKALNGSTIQDMADQLEDMIKKSV